MSAASSRSSRRPRRPRLLLVDDDDANLLTLGALLEDEGFDVETAGSCAAARGCLESDRRYAGVLLDGALGDGRGADLVPLVRASRPHVPIMLVTGSCREERADATTAVDAVVVKGAGFDPLLAVLRGLLARAR